MTGCLKISLIGKNPNQAWYKGFNKCSCWQNLFIAHYWDEWLFKGNCDLRHN